MPLFDEPPLHDFPDRAIRHILQQPDNLRNLVAAVLPDLVDRFDFEHVEPVGREFLLDDWRRRESDLLFRLPFLAGEEAPPALVCILIEHQSEPDPWMPLRVLVYAALFWEREWKAGEAEQTPRQPFRLSPVVPIVLHTGPAPWRTHRELAELIGGPEALRAFAPRWQPLFWDLAEHAVDEVLGAAGEFLAALAVVRVERADAETFRAVFTRVLQRLEGLSEQERVRWEDLLWFVLSWALRRRPAEEQEQLLAAARSSQADALRQEEIAKMSKTIQRTWEEELLARGEARGRAEGEAHGQLQARRDDLRALLEERFGSLPEALAQRIEATEDLDRLREALRQVLHVQAPSELDL
jgi:predicted transposase YdaD